MKKIYVLALALVMTLGFATNSQAESGKGSNGIGVSNSLELKGDVKTSIRGDDKDKDDDDDKKNEDKRGDWDKSNHGPRVFGTVTAVSGNNITITSKGFGSNGQTITYIVDATNAKIKKAGESVTISSITVGTSILIDGTINGTTIVAKEIKFGKGDDKNLNPMLEGNGQPIIGGKVTAVNGSTITLTNKSNVVYTVDVTNAKIVKNSKTAVVSDIKVGDTILAQGTINGTAVVATSVIDQGSEVKNPNGDNGKKKGFFRKFGGWFSRIFGF